MESFHLAKKTVKEDGKRMLSDVRGCDRNRADGHSWKRYGQCFSPVELPDEDAIRELKIPVILKFIKMRCCRQGSWVDMSDVLNELYESYGDKQSESLFDRSEVYRF